MSQALTPEVMRLTLKGISIEVPKEPPTPYDCPVQSRIECDDGLWCLDVWKDGIKLGSYGPESFTSEVFRALMRENLGDVILDEIVLPWISG